MELQLTSEQLAEMVKEAKRKEKEKEKEKKAEAKKREKSAKGDSLSHTLLTEVNSIIDTNELDISLSGLLVLKNGSNYSATEKLRLGIDKCLFESGFELRREHLEITAGNLLNAIREDKRKVIIDRFKFNSECEQYANKAIDKIVSHFRDPKSISSPEIDALAIKQFIYQVKTKFINNTITINNPLCLIIFGTQKVGKTRWVQDLVSPIKELYSEAKSSELSTDNYEKNVPALASNYIVYFDDLAKLGEGEIDNFKSFTTSSNVYFRVFRTQSRDTKTNVSTILASTNLPLSDILYDDTGNRRFYQFTTRMTLPQDLTPFYKEINSIDYLKMWRGINENVEPINEEMFKVIKEYQHTWGTNSTIHQFLSDCGDAFLKEEEEFDLTKHEKIDLNKLQKLIHSYANYFGIKIRVVSNNRILDIFNRDNIQILGMNGARLRLTRIQFVVIKSKYEKIKSTYISSNNNGSKL